MPSAISSTDKDAVIEAIKEFAFNFFRSTLRLDPEYNNKLISPFGIYLALSMLHLGAKEATKAAIVMALQLTPASVGGLNAVAKDLLHRLPASDPKMRISIANSIWYSHVWPSPLNSFLNDNAEYYNGFIQSLDFSDILAANVINGWIAEMTDQKITSMVSRTDADDLIYLVNAIYFNGPWLYPFASDNTWDGPFDLADGRKIQASFIICSRS